MKSCRRELSFHTPTRRAFLNITPQVEEALRESGIREGLCLVNAMHITASVFINDDESGCTKTTRSGSSGWRRTPDRAVPHNDTGEDNADAHLKRQVMGREVVVAVTGGKLDFGPWEQIFYGEFDGRRKETGAHQRSSAIEPDRRALVGAASRQTPPLLQPARSGRHYTTVQGHVSR